MALSGEATAKLAAILECKICLNTYHNRKQLNCGHTYCKDCLDDILQFRENGSAELSCPLRCTKRTILNQDETTASLMTVYSLTDILDEMPNVAAKKFICQQCRKCNQTLSSSCTICGATICNECQNTHLCENKSYTTVTFNKNLQEIQPLCTTHKSLAKDVCVECENTFICAYCIHRNHTKHERKTITQLGLEAKDWIQTFVTSFVDRKIILETLTREYEEAMMNLESGREIFAQELKMRKIKRIEEFLKMLTAEDENLLKEFDEKTRKFKENVTSAVFANKAKTKEFSEYINKVKEKSHFELVAEKLEIDRNFRRLSSSLISIPRFHSHLIAINDKDRGTYPLGQLKICFDEVNMAGITPNDSLICENIIDKTERQYNDTQLVNDLTAMIDYLEEYDIADGNAIGVAEESDVPLKGVPLVTKSCTFEECIKIIQTGDDKIVQLLLNNHPDIVKMRGDNGSTLLMKAAFYNKPSIVKDLIDAGSDVNAVDDLNWNAYHISAWRGHSDVLKVLINHDVTNINNVHNYNGTPLYFASRFGHVECVKLLLSVPHIDVNIRNKYNKAAYDVARNDTVRSLLEAYLIK